MSINNTSSPSCSCNGNTSSNSNIIKLNIGGYKYVTYKETLISNSSFFNGLLNSDFYNVLLKGYYFIDRDGEYFQPILSFMRTGSFILPKKMSIDSLYREVDFYGVDQLASLIQHKRTSIKNIAGGTYFIIKLPIPTTTTITDNNNASLLLSLDNNNKRIIHVIIKANIMALYYNDGCLEIWVYKGMSFHWIKISSHICFNNEFQIKEMTGRISKNDLNETDSFSISARTTREKTLLLWCIDIDYHRMKVKIKERVISIAHDTDYFHFLINHSFLACISRYGLVTVIDLADVATDNNNEHNLNENITVTTASTTANPFKTIILEDRVSGITNSIESSLFIACSNGKLYELKQNIRKNWEWTVDEIYKLYDPEFFYNTYGFSLPISNGNNNYAHTIDNNGVGGLGVSGFNNNNNNNNGGIDIKINEIITKRKIRNINNSNNCMPLITCLNTSIISNGGKLKSVLVLGTDDGVIHFLYKTKNMDKFYFAATFICNDGDPIKKVLVSGGEEGVFITALSTSGISKTWHYLFSKLQLTRQINTNSNSNSNSGGVSNSGATSKCIGCLSLYSISILDQTTTSMLDENDSNKNQQQQQQQYQHSPIIEGLNNYSVNNCGHINNYYNIFKFKNIKDLHFTSNSSGQKESMTTFNNLDGGNNFKFSIHHQIKIVIDCSNNLLIYAGSHRNTILGIDYELPTAPIAVIPLIDKSKVQYINISTFGGCEPTIHDQSFQLLTFHQSSQVYVWDLKSVNNYFVSTTTIPTQLLNNENQNNTNSNNVIGNSVRKRTGNSPLITAFNSSFGNNEQNPENV